jgi:glycosyltransferase involved in cell wall biosynthesis
MRIEVIVPVRDGAAVLADCLAAIRGQTLAPAAIHLSVAPSTDATDLVIASSSQGDPRFRVHQNPAGDRGSGLNVALAMLDAETEAIAMVDAQSRIEPDYLERSAAVLEATGAAVVGGAMQPVGEGVIGRAIAAALASPVGVGDSSFHFEGAARDVESVYLGVYRRSVLDAAGRYDPSLVRTEDDDMNARIRAAGGRIRLDPSIRSRYLGRQTLRGLFRQYRGYGHSKVALAAKRPGAIRPRHLVPAGLIIAIVATGIASLAAWPPALPLLFLVYLGSLLVAGFLRPELSVPSRLAFVAAAATMHLGYGIGTWQAILSGTWRR